MCLMPMIAIRHQDLLVSVESVANMVAHVSCTRTTNTKPPNANPISIMTVALRLTSSDQQRGRDQIGEEDDRIHKRWWNANPLWSDRDGVAHLLRSMNDNGGGWTHSRSSGCPCGASTGGTGGGSAIAQPVVQQDDQIHKRRRWGLNSSNYVDGVPGRMGEVLVVRQLAVQQMARKP
jgi:hypothetical protein